MSFILAVLMQVGPAPTVPASPSVEPPELSEWRELERAKSREERTGFAAVPVAECRAKAMAEAVAAVSDAQNWLAAAEGEERGVAYHCLGLASANQGRWDEAAEAFGTASGHMQQSRTSYRAQLTALAGNAWLAAGDTQRALDLLDAAAQQARDAGLTGLAGEIAIDRARALVALERPTEASDALTAAREAAPENALAWLLSATLSRRSNELATARAQIERAVALDATDPSADLEAGLIAALAGRDEAARASWQSVLALASGSVQAQAARDYLAQLEAP